MGFKLAILLACLLVNLTVARKARAVQNDGNCGGDTACMDIESPRGGAVGCCFNSCAGQKVYKTHLSHYDNKCSGGKICCGKKGAQARWPWRNSAS